VSLAGAGAFLVATCRELATEMVAAWMREGQHAAIVEKYGDAHLHARRLVAQRCLYGVDKNAAAVELAKLVVSGDEELEPTRRQLANLGLTEKGFYVDVNGDLTREGRVTALPTTFLVTAQGAVVQRARGFSHTWLWQLKRKLGGTTP
jgi:hypothetical protein